MEILIEWLTALARWGHIMAGISWIGTSFYFNWFDLSARPPQEPVHKENVRNTLHEVHGGSFYYHEQYWPDTDYRRTLAHAGPAQLTFLTGAALMALTYWYGVSVYLIDPQVYDLSKPSAILLSVGSIALAYPLYDKLCREVSDERKVMIVMAIATVIGAFVFSQLFGGRAAYLHVGAVLGTVMVANVQFVIIPNHIAMRGQIKAGEPLDTHHGYLAKRRSQHNNYITLPVVFCMLGIHFPLAYSHQFSWIVLSLMLAAGVTLRHFRNVRFITEKTDLRLLFLAVALSVAAIGLTFVPKPVATQDMSELDDPVLRNVYDIVQSRCATCHSARPTSEDFASAPLGLVLDTMAQLQAKAELVYQRTIVTEDMPIGNVTEMTDTERETLRSWLTSIGAGEAPEQ
jgi:uncharacterized membrane protein